jgi:uncharacterized protein (TIGR00159 family)
MLDAVRVFLEDVGHHIRIADVFDIGLVSVFLFIVLVWLRQSTAGSARRRAFVVALAFLGVYLMARFLELYLVEQLTQVMFIVFLIAAVIVFQSDIRRMLDRVGTWSFSGPGKAEPYGPIVDLLAQASARLADTKTGALIAIKGREPWDHLIQGGIALDGQISLPLLYSLFDHRTPGHDGAVLIEDRRITLFGAHLPLARHLPQVSRSGGTRHAAAQGLAEECDALVIVVSEERGTISVAEEGELQVLDANALAARLEEFWRRHYTAERLRLPWWRRYSMMAVLSVVLATVLWFLIAYSPDTIYRTFDNVPIAFRNLPPDWSVAEDTPSSAQVTLLGSEQAFRQLDPSELEISFDLADPAEGTYEFGITEENLELSSGLRLNEVDPSALSVVLKRLQVVSVPVRVDTIGVLPGSLILEGLQPQPPTVRLLLPDSLADLKEILTETLDLRAVTGSTLVRRNLVLPTGARLAQDEPSSVDVSVALRGSPVPEGAVREQ